jgi:hypothetical protein
MSPDQVNMFTSIAVLGFIDFGVHACRYRLEYKNIVHRAGDATASTPGAAHSQAMPAGQALVLG